MFDSPKNAIKLAKNLIKTTGRLINNTVFIFFQFTTPSLLHSRRIVLLII